MQMSVTGLVVTVLIIILGIYDLVAVVYGYLTGKTTTTSVSNFLIKAGFTSPMVICAFSYVLGHLYGVMYPAECPPPSANILAPNFWMGMTFVLLGALVVLWRKKNEKSGLKS